MTTEVMVPPGPSARPGGRAGTLGAAAFGMALAIAFSSASARAQPPRPATAASAGSAADGGISWQELSASQREFLRPLEHDWRTLDAPQRRKWLALTGRVPKMSADERERIQTRMTDWAKLTPEQRGQARLRYQEAKRLPLHDREARWDAYQMLPSERKRQLAERAAQAASAASRRTAAQRERAAQEGPQRKSSLAASSEPIPAPRPVAPTLVQARPGATTISITRPPAPPPHQQVGMPKIAATPEYVNKWTLLPRLGPQAVASSPSSAASVPGRP